jgi:thiosulfate/3-mercaptopyruvate sulfurtransferase
LPLNKESILNTIPVVKTKDLLNHLSDPNAQIVDVRSADAYNGWRLNGEKRSGHIRGARSFPAKWIRYIEWIEIARHKGFKPPHHLIFYGHNIEEPTAVAEAFQKAGFHQVSLYTDFVNEWCERADLPMDLLPNYHALVPPAWLKQLLSTGKTAEHSPRSYVLLHTHYRNMKDYEKGHIPGAVALDTLRLESPEDWNRRSPIEIKKALEEIGITHQTTVILYGRFSFPRNEDPFPGSSAGHLAAFRCAFIMKWAGVQDVRVLNGGLQSWSDSGEPLIQQTRHPNPIFDFGTPIPGNPSVAVDLPEAKEIPVD